MNLQILIFAVIFILSPNLHANWEKLDINQGVNITGIEKIDNTLLVITADLNNKLESSGILRSIDNGETWLEQDYFLPSYIPLYDIEKNKSNNLYLACESNGIFISSDKGQSFLRIFNISGGYETFKDIFINNDNILLLSNRNLYMNLNGHDSLFSESLTNKLNLSNNDSLISVYYDGNTIYLSVSNMGILISSDSGNNWSFMNEGLQNKNISNISGDGLGNILCAVDDYGLFRWSELNKNWNLIEESQLIFEQEKKCKKILYDKNSFYFGTNENIYEINSKSWLITKLTSNQSIQGISDFEIYDEELYFSMNFGGLYKLENGTIKEYKIPYCGMKTFSISGNDEYIFQGSSIGTISRSSNFGKQWQQLVPYNYKRESEILKIITNENEVIITNDIGETFYSNNNGDTFHIFNNNRVFLDLIKNPNGIYAISDTGIYLSENNGKDWELLEFTKMIEKPLCMSIYKGRIIYIGTDGNGIYKVDLDNRTTKKIEIDLNNGKVLDIEHLGEEEFLFGFDRVGFSGLYRYSDSLIKLNNSYVTSIFKRDDLIVVGQKYGSTCLISYDNGNSFELETIEMGGILARDIYISKNKTILISFTGSLAGIYKSDMAISNIIVANEEAELDYIELNNDELKIKLKSNLMTLKAISIFSLEGKLLFKKEVLYSNKQSFEIRNNIILRNQLYLVKLDFIEKSSFKSIIIKLISN